MSQKKTKYTAEDFLNGMKPDAMFSDAQNLISSAVNVLEEEIAAGILAAKNIEKDVIDVDDIRSDPNDLFNRIRRDTHEAVDLFLDAFTAISKQMNDLAALNKTAEAGANGKDTSHNGAAPRRDAEQTRTAESTRRSKTTQNETGDGGVILLKSGRPLEPGESVDLQFSLLEDGETAGKIAFRKTNLIGVDDLVIHSRAIKITPQKLTLQPNVEEHVSVRVNIPKNAAAGHYNAFITATSEQNIRIVLDIEVVKTA